MNSSLSFSGSHGLTCVVGETTRPRTVSFFFFPLAQGLRLSSSFFPPLKATWYASVTHFLSPVSLSLRKRASPVCSVSCPWKGESGTSGHPFFFFFSPPFFTWSRVLRGTLASPLRAKLPRGLLVPSFEKRSLPPFSPENDRCPETADATPIARTLLIPQRRDEAPDFSLNKFRTPPFFLHLPSYTE